MQVLVIHGAGGFARLKRDDFVEAIKAKEVGLDSLRRSTDWKGNLQGVLGPTFDVLQPRMPDADQPQYDAWKAWFERIASLLDERVVLVGHSLGGLFLMKYLSENKSPKKVELLVTVAAPYTGPEVEGMLESRLAKGGWLLTGDVAAVAAQCAQVVVAHSTDDPVVPYSASERYAGKLPQAKIIALEGKGHVTGESLPEVVDVIRALSA